MIAGGYLAVWGLFASVGGVPAVADDGCAPAHQALRALSTDDADAYPKYLEAIEHLPDDAAPLRARARARAGVDGDMSSAIQMMQVALADGCRQVSSTKTDPLALREELAQIQSDPALFAGRRAAPDLIDRVSEWLGRWLRTLLESTAMQKYAEVSRGLFLGVFLLIVIAMSWRLWRERIARQPTDTAVATSLQIERERVRHFRAWRDEAEGHLQAGRLRAALLSGERALLARLGEMDRDAVTPARTHREILLACSPGRANALAGPFQLFDVLVFGDRATPEEVTRFLNSVDASEKALGERA